MEQLNLNWLRQARKEKRFTMKMAADILGKDRSTMWRYENGQTPLMVDDLFTLLNAYGKSIRDVVMVKEADHAGI